MALKANAVLTFVDYVIEDGGARCHFLCADPGPGQPSDYYVLFTDAEIAGITSLATASTLAQTKLSRYLRASGISTKLDQLVGRSLTVA